MKTSYTLTFSVSFIKLIKHVFEYYESIVAPEGTSYNGLKGEAWSKRFVRGVFFYELC